MWRVLAVDQDILTERSELLPYFLRQFRFGLAPLPYHFKLAGERISQSLVMARPASNQNVMGRCLPI